MTQTDRETPTDFDKELQNNTVSLILATYLINIKKLPYSDARNVATGSKSYGSYERDLYYCKSR